MQTGEFLAFILASDALNSKTQRIGMGGEFLTRFCYLTVNSTPGVNMSGFLRLGGAPVRPTSDPSRLLRSGMIPFRFSTADISALNFFSLLLSFSAKHDCAQLHPLQISFLDVPRERLRVQLLN